MIVGRYTLIGALVISCGALASCDAGFTDQNQAANDIQEQAGNGTFGSNSQVPRMVIRSPSYRCDDGGALYVDVMSDENAVNVRDTRRDVPTRLWRQGGTGPFTTENCSLSGTGDVVRYAGPDRPEQECRAASD